MPDGARLARGFTCRPLCPPVPGRLNGRAEKRYYPNGAGSPHPPAGGSMCGVRGCGQRRADAWRDGRQNYEH
jgi:hypothetical protein